MAKVIWPNYLLELLLELPSKDTDLILEKTRSLKRFPRMYPVRTKRRFRRHRWMLAGRWIVYYRVVDGSVYIRALWPAQIP
jgi:hypothetical protein